MAIYYARANGNVNATNVWSTTQAGATSDLFPSFNSSDTLMANGFTITLNVNTTVLEIKNDTSNGATSGGGFTLNNGTTLTANVVGGTANAFLLGFGTNAICTIIGSISGGSTSFAVVNITAAGVVLSVIGNINGGNATSDAILIGVNSTVTITGNINGANVGAGFAAVRNNSSAAILNIIGTATGGNSTTTGYAVSNVSTGTVNITGTSIGGSVSAGSNNGSTGTMTITRAKGNGFGNGSIGLSSAVGVNSSQNGLTRVYEIEYGDLGQSPTSGPVFLFPSSSNVALFYRSGTTKKTLVDASSSSGLLPSASDVRRGIRYNAGTNIGTMDVPASASVALGVGVDNTIGTAILTSGNIADIWNVPVSGISVSNSIGERLKNCSTVATMGQQLSAALNNVQ